jgi:hypothetical protein
MNQENDEKKQFISNEKFQLLQLCQQSVYQATESSPSIRKIINELITEGNLEKVAEKFISVWKI